MESLLLKGSTSRSIPSFQGLRAAQTPFRQTLPATSLPAQQWRSASSKTLVRAAAAEQADATPSRTPSGSIFGREVELTGVPGVVKSLPTPVRYAVCGAIIVGSAGVGFAAGSKFQPPVGQVAGVVVLGALGAGAAHVVNSASKEVAAADLHNSLVRLSDPLQLRRGEAAEIANKYGVSLEDERYRAEMKDLYEKFVSSVIPPGNEPLRGDESDLIIRFKASMGLEDEDAAAAHIEVGRRIFRQRLETGDKEAAFEERQSFQKLVYVSNLVFGDKSKFLLPWKRIFKVSDAQVDIAVRNNSQSLLQAQLDATKGEFTVDNLKELRALQKKYKLSDDLAADMVRAEARKRVEEYINQALDVLKARTRIKDTTKVVDDLDAMRAYNAHLAALAKSASADDLLPGIGPVSVFGGEYDTDRQMDDLKLLYKTYLSEALNAPRLSTAQTKAWAELRNTFGMGKCEAEEASDEVTRKVYRRKLANLVTGGELDRAASKAEVLQELCDSLKFDPEKAAQIHEEIYRQKLQQCLADKSLSDDDVAALNRLRVLLCVPKSAVDQAHGDICGGIFTKVVDDAIGAGIDGYDGDMRDAVRAAVKGLRLPLQSALDIATKAVRAVFLTYIKRARGTMSRAEGARELKKMVIFSNLTVSQLLDDIRGKTDEPAAAASAATGEGSGPAVKAEDGKPEEKEAEEGYDDEMPLLQSMRKTKGQQKEGKAQKEVSVKDDLELRERLDLYKSFLLFCLQGDTTGMPMGTSLTVQRDTSDFIRLSQLGDILGLAPAEVSSVHQGLAEQAFKVQAQTLLADGQLTKARAEQLKIMQRELGLPDAAAQKVVQSITSTKMAGAIDAAIKAGRLSVDEVKQLKESGVDIGSMVAEKVRLQMFSKLVQKEFEKGTGDFDEKELLEKLPGDLGLEEDVARKTVKEIARERLKGALVLAVSNLRQKKPDQVVAVLNNMLACDKADAATESLTWAVKEELLDLYSLFLSKHDAESSAAGRMRELLGIDDATAASLSEIVSKGGFNLDVDNSVEENFVF
ncbi:hypothetical protein CLOM_g6814 [Closterium sp. NIES-68]|nr:hypothetical protein CLOM_g6814 [Closterium sp. NIES-68]